MAARLADRYEKLRQLGQGGMGDVWLVAEKGSRLLYAMKRIREEYLRGKDLKRFERELHILSSLNHPNIIKFYEADVADRSYLMEYCPDGDLASNIGKARMPSNLDILRQLTDAVAFLHANSVLHRDIKPQNILIAPGGGVRLADFGIAAENVPGRSVLTTSVWVSVGFSAPEQFRSMADVTEQADVYAIGAVYFWLVTGQTLDTGPSREAQLALLNDLDRAIVERTTERDPASRGTAASLAAMIAECDKHNLHACFGMTATQRLEFLRRRYDQFVNAKEFWTGERTALLRDMRDSIRAAMLYERDEAVRTRGHECLTELAGLIEAQKAEDELEYPGSHRDEVD